MKISCHDIFQTIKKRILWIISDLTTLTHENEEKTETKYQVTIDLLTLEMKYLIHNNNNNNNSKQKGQKLPTKNSINKNNDEINNLFVSKDKQENEQQTNWISNAMNIYASSTEIFLDAEKIKIYLENQMITLMNELLVTVSHSIISLSLLFFFLFFYVYF